MFYRMNYKSEEFKKLLGHLSANTSFSLLKFAAQGENNICLLITSKDTT